MHRLLLQTRSTAVTMTLVLIAVIVMFSDAVAAPGVIRDLVVAIGAELAALGGSAWYSRLTTRALNKECVTCHDSPRGIDPP